MRTPMDGPAAPGAFEGSSAEVERLIRQHSKTFSLATALLPRAQRLAIRVLYAFCRSTDDIVDSGTATLEDLEAWRAQTDLPIERQPSAVLRAWGQIRARFQIERRFEQELIDGVAMDLVTKSYQSWPDLERYCYLVASTVGLMSIPILGLGRGVRFEQAMPYAIRLGVALQLTNILRDVGEDAARGRVYLPAADLRRFGLTPEDVLAGVTDARFVQLMQFEIGRARALYRQALPGVALLAPSARLAVGAAALLYRAILREIEHLGYDVHHHRAHTSAARKLVLLPGILWSILRLKRGVRPPEFTGIGGRRQDPSAG